MKEPDRLWVYCRSMLYRTTGVAAAGYRAPPPATFEVPRPVVTVPAPPTQLLRPTPHAAMRTRAEYVNIDVRTPGSTPMDGRAHAEQRGVYRGACVGSARELHY